MLSTSILNAWVSENRICVGQEKVDDNTSTSLSNQSNEITAIPNVLESLDIEDSVITIDAMVSEPVELSVRKP
jgi:hypothetical protein